jgi:hypothetical protein
MPTPSYGFSFIFLFLLLFSYSLTISRITATQNLTTSRRLHTDLFTTISERLQDWDDHQTCIGNIFLHFAPIMIIYTEYSTSYQTAVDTWIKLNTNADFVAKHRQLRSKKSLDNLMIMPIQRLPRYNLLIRDLHKYTPESHSDYKNLTDAIDVIQRLCDRIDECTTKAIDAQAMVELAAKNR